MITLEAAYGEKWEYYNISLSVLGSKLQAIGAAFFCFLHHDVRLVFATPRIYNAKRYSDGWKAIYSLSLGSTNSLGKRLWQAGSLVVDE